MVKLEGECLGDCNLDCRGFGDVWIEIIREGNARNGLLGISLKGLREADVGRSTLAFRKLPKLPFHV